MKKISVKNIIVFRKKSDKYKKIFLASINKPKALDSEKIGGNYWVRSISAISSAFKTNDKQYIKDKIDDISNDYNNCSRKQTKDMYQRNLNILHNYEDFDFSTWYPNKTFNVLDKASKNSIIEINKVPIQILPNQVFTFTINKVDYVGAIWFVAKLEGYTKPELGIFAEALFKYLENSFSNKYKVSPDNCLVVDVLNIDEVNYQMILDNEFPALLNDTLKSIRANL
jgi:hypothetical protein